MRHETLDEYLQRLGFQHLIEGHCGQLKQQRQEFEKYICGSVKQVMEIGFNGGHSSETFLQTNPNVHVTSFDIGQHAYVEHGKRFLDFAYPHRHTLILGDSRTTVPAFAARHPHLTFDVIYIDGGHEYAVAKQDLQNCRHLARKDTVVIMDDVMFRPEWSMPWNSGPTQAWSELVRDGIIMERARVPFCIGRGHCVGVGIMHMEQTVTDILYPAFVRDIKHAISGRFVWKRISDICEACSKVLAGAASVLAFSSGVYEEKALSFASGCVGTLSIVLGLFASYSSAESKERTVRLNVTLQRLGMGNQSMPAYTASEPELTGPATSTASSANATTATSTKAVSDLIQEYELHHANVGNSALDV